MIPGKYDITIYRGSTWSISIDAKDVNEVSTDFEVDYIDNPTPDSGEVRMQIRPAWKVKPGDTLLTPLVELTTANGKIDVTTTIITLTIPASETEDFTFSSGTYDIELVTGDTEPVVDKILYGSVTVMNEKTK